MNEKIDLNNKENQEAPKKRVLVAEDDSSVQAAVVAMMDALGWDVVVVSDGSEILEQLGRGEKFDLIITDNNMPKMDGIDAIKEMKKTEQYAKIPVILGSGAMGMGLVREAEALGAKCLKKPYGFAEIEELLDQIFK